MESICDDPEIIEQNVMVCINCEISIVTIIIVP